MRPARAPVDTNRRVLGAVVRPATESLTGAEPPAGGQATRWTPIWFGIMGWVQPGRSAQSAIVRGPHASATGSASAKVIRLLTGSITVNSVPPHSGRSRPGRLFLYALTINSVW